MISFLDVGWGVSSWYSIYLLFGWIYFSLFLSLIIYYLKSLQGSGSYFLIFFVGDTLFLFFYFRSYSFLFFEVAAVSFFDIVISLSFILIPLEINLFFSIFSHLWLCSSLYSYLDNLFSIGKGPWSFCLSFFYFLWPTFENLMKLSLLLDLFRHGDLLLRWGRGFYRPLLLWLSTLICAEVFFIYNL